RGGGGAGVGGDLGGGGEGGGVGGGVGGFGGKCRRQIVAARLDEDQVERGKFCAHLGHRREIDRGVLADGGVRAAAGLHAGDALGYERAREYQVFGVPIGVDVVGDGGVLGRLAHTLTQRD